MVKNVNAHRKTLAVDFTILAKMVQPMNQSNEDQQHHHSDLDTVRYGIITVSSSRNIDDDPSGDLLEEAIRSAGHAVEYRSLLSDDEGDIRTEVETVLKQKSIDCLISTGGTGVTPDDVTIEAISPLFEKALPGFGELFRQLSYDDIGVRVVGTRAVGGIVRETPVFCLPGSTNAVELAIKEIILPVVPHVAGLANHTHQ